MKTSTTNPLFNILDRGDETIFCIEVGNNPYGSVMINEVKYWIKGTHITILKEKSSASSKIKMDNKEYHITLELSDKNEKKFKLRAYFNGDDTSDTNVTFKTNNKSDDEEISEAREKSHELNDSEVEGWKNIQPEELRMLKLWLHSIAHTRLLPYREKIRRNLDTCYQQHKKLNRDYLEMMNNISGGKEITDELLKAVDRCIIKMKRVEDEISKLNPNWVHALAEPLAFDFAIINSKQQRTTQPTFNQNDSTLKAPQPKPRVVAHKQKSLSFKQPTTKVYDDHVRLVQRAANDVEKECNKCYEAMSRTKQEMTKSLEIKNCLKELDLSIQSSDCTDIDQIIERITQYNTSLLETEKKKKPKKQKSKKKPIKKQAKKKTVFGDLIREVKNPPLDAASSQAQPDISSTLGGCFKEINFIIREQIENIHLKLNSLLSLSAGIGLEGKKQQQANILSKILDAISIEETFFQELFDESLKNHDNEMIGALIQYSSQNAKEFFLYVIDNNLPDLIRGASYYLRNQVEIPIDEGDLSPLGYALKKDEPECFSELLEMGSNIFNAYNAFGIPIAYYALSQYHPKKCFEALVNYADDSYVKLVKQLINHLKEKIDSTLPEKTRLLLTQDIQLFEILAGIRFCTKPITFFNSSMSRATDWYVLSIFDLKKRIANKDMPGGQSEMDQIDECFLNSELLLQVRKENLRTICDIYSTPHFLKVFNKSVSKEERSVSMEKMSTMYEQEVANLKSDTDDIEEKNPNIFDEYLSKSIVGTLYLYKLYSASYEVCNMYSSCADVMFNRKSLNHRNHAEIVNQLKNTGDFNAALSQKSEIYNFLMKNIENDRLNKFVCDEIKTNGLYAFDFEESAYSEGPLLERIKHAYRLTGQELGEIKKPYQGGGAARNIKDLQKMFR